VARIREALENKLVVTVYFGDLVTRLVWFSNDRLMLLLSRLEQLTNFMIVCNFLILC
jgi:hypothetical protein